MQANRPDHQIGHSYFMNVRAGGVAVWYHRIVPLLQVLLQRRGATAELLGSEFVGTAQDAGIDSGWEVGDAYNGELAEIRQLSVGEFGLALKTFVGNS